MKKFLIILHSELKEYLSAKGFVIFTLLIAIVGAGGLCLPRFIDLSDFTGVEVVAKKEQEETSKKEEQDKLYILDEAKVIDEETLESYFPEYEWVEATNAKEIEQAVESQEAKAGFVVKAPDSYIYYVYNRGLDDELGDTFNEAMQVFYRQYYCKKNALNYDEIEQMYDAQMMVEEEILNKDTRENYIYCYIFIVLIFMMIVMYGQMIAVSVTTEKSNRAIEVLVTSTTPNSLLFGKVIAGAIGGLLQFGLVIGAILISYQINREAWGGALDFVLQVPIEVLIAFALFGIGGYLFYAFIYGAAGALVSKTEDVSKSSSGLMTIIMIVYIVSLTQLNHVDGIVTKVLSFLPISSYSTMFARIAMGTVQTWEVVVSFIILVASILGAGWIGAKIYRLGTLRYGNPIKFKTALKSLRYMKEQEGISK